VVVVPATTILSSFPVVASFGGIYFLNYILLYFTIIL